MPDYAGHVVHNYRLGDVLGEGGFGVVYLATHEELGRQAAVKILHPEYSRHENLVERFFREAKAVCAIGHRSIIDVQNVGRLDSGEPYCLMEYFDGASLSDHLRQRGAVALRDLPLVFDPVAAALTAAHDVGIVHRDLKPDNIMVREAGGRVVDVKLLDFGIAKLVDGTDTVTSRTGLPMGTPTFMAPEQARDSKNVDHRADVYGFAATVYASLAKRPPYVAENVTDLIVKVQTTSAPGIRTYVPEAPIELERALARCLDKDPDKRPSSLRSAWKQIRDSISAHIPTAPEPGSGDPTSVAKEALAYQDTTPAEVDDAMSADSLARTRVATSGPRKWRAIAFAVAAAGIASGVALYVFAERDSKPTPTSTSTPTPTAVADAGIPRAPHDAAVAPVPVPAVPSAADAAVAPPDAPPRTRPVRRRVDAATARTGPDCSTKSFARVYDAPNPREAIVLAALKRLKQCNRLGHIDKARSSEIRAALTRKL